MAAERIAPIDPITQLPALIAPGCEHFTTNNPDVDKHHLWRLAGLNAAGIALRNSLIQIVERDRHNHGPNAFHHHYDQLKPALNGPSVFRRIVLACSGVIPQQVVVIRNGEVIERLISPTELAFMQTPLKPGSLQYKYLQYREQPIRDYFRIQVFKQSINHLSNGLIDEFLNTDNRDRKLSIGKFLLYNASAVAADSIREDYFRLRKGGHLHPLMPTDVQMVVFSKLGPMTQQSRILDRYESELMVA